MHGKQANARASGILQDGPRQNDAGSVMETQMETTGRIGRLLEGAWQELHYWDWGRGIRIS